MWKEDFFILGRKTFYTWKEDFLYLEGRLYIWKFFFWKEDLFGGKNNYILKEDLLYLDGILEGRLNFAKNNYFWM